MPRKAKISALSAGISQPFDLGPCPHCGDPIAIDEPAVKQLYSQFTRSRQKVHAGPTGHWRKHSKKAGKRCRCRKCSEARQSRRKPPAQKPIPQPQPIELPPPAPTLPQPRPVRPRVIRPGGMW